MTHEILFRAKRKDNGEWIESLTLLKLNEYLYMFQTAWGEITYDLQHNITAIFGKSHFFVEVIPETVGQYTGLTDKNGVKIFEGDIICHDDGKYHEVVFEQRNGHAYFSFVTSKDETWHFDNDFLRQFKVVGNIHDDFNKKIIMKSTF